MNECILNTTLPLWNSCDSSQVRYHLARILYLSAFEAWYLTSPQK